MTKFDEAWEDVSRVLKDIDSYRKLIHEKEKEKAESGVSDNQSDNFDRIIYSCEDKINEALSRLDNLLIKAKKASNEF